MADLGKTAQRSPWRQRTVTAAEPLHGAFFWLSAFFVVYCARPEDWIPGLKYIPLAKISGIFALLGLVLSTGRSKRGLRDLPREAFYLCGIIALFCLAALLSPVWRGGALLRTVDWSKAVVAWVLIFLGVSSFKRLRKIIFIQTFSVVIIAVVSVLKGRNHPRLEGVIGGIYSNPNDLAFAIVLSLPFCIAFLLHTKNLMRKVAWIAAILAMCTALFLTASRAGFITLVISGAFGLWQFGVKQRRPQLIAAAALVTLVIGMTAGQRLKDRFLAISGEETDAADTSARGSFEQRRRLIELSFPTIAHYPLGIGMGMFPNYSREWREVHVSYLQITVEGGIAAGILYLLFFARGFANLRQWRRMGGWDEESDLLARALHISLIGFLVGALFSPEAYQFFPYFAVGYTSVLLAIAKEKKQQDSVADVQARPELQPRGSTAAGALAPVR
jgi:O-antigen ligase